MSTLTNRTTKGSSLTWNEVDANFTNLNNDKAEKSGTNFTGNVGIGTTSPLAPLHVNSSSYHGVAGTNLLRIISTGGANYFQSGITATGGSAAPLVFTNINAGSEWARFDANGKFGIGTSTPISPLSVKGTWTTGQGILNIDANSGTQFTGLVCANNTAGKIYLYHDNTANTTTLDGAGALVLSVGVSEKANINSSGFTNVYSTNNAFAARSAIGAGTAILLYGGYYSATSTTTGTNSYRVWTNGNVENTNGSYGSISDVKLKENIIDAASQWSDIKALQVRKFNFKEGQTHTQIGLVAQEVELVSPGLVSESPDRDEEGNDLGTTTKSVSYSVLYMKAVKALQEAMERIEALEAKVNAKT